MRDDADPAEQLDGRKTRGPRVMSGVSYLIQILLPANRNGEPVSPESFAKARILLMRHHSKPRRSTGPILLTCGRRLLPRRSIRMPSGWRAVCSSRRYRLPVTAGPVSGEQLGAALRAAAARSILVPSR